MQQFKKDFIKFLIDSEALLFGEFKLKSGRVAPYFINTGKFSDGNKIRKLGEFYAESIKENFKDFDGVYGPAYKGIPLCITSAIGLEKLGINKGYLFNRKKLKDYALKDNLIGMKYDENTKLVLVDDVITSGAAIRESLEILKEHGNPKIIGIAISVDRQEKGPSGENALKTLSNELGVPIHPIVTFTEIMETVSEMNLLDSKMKETVDNYRKEYGAVE